MSRPPSPPRHAFHLAVTSEIGTLVEARRLRPSGGPITIDGLAGGAYTIDVAGTEPRVTVRAGKQRHPHLGKPAASV